MEILALIPARGGSKGIPRKNMVALCGKPLIYYTLKAAKESILISRIIVSTDDQEIADYAKTIGVEVPFIRPKKLADDLTQMLDVVFHALNWLNNKEGYKPDILVLLQPTSPLRTSIHIDEALDLLIKENVDSVVSVTEVPHQYNPYSVMKIENGLLVPFIDSKKSYNRRQDKPIFYARNGPAIIAVRCDSLLVQNKLYCSNGRPYIMRQEQSVDLDSDLDLDLLESIMSQESKKEREDQ